MNKAVAVPYIIAVILGIVVVAVIGFWFYLSAGQIGGTTSKAFCDGKRTQYCLDWTIRGLETGKEPGTWDNYAPGCTNIGVVAPSLNDCRGLTSLKKSTGTNCGSNEECQSGICSDISCRDTELDETKTCTLTCPNSANCELSGTSTSSKPCPPFTCKVVVTQTCTRKSGAPADTTCTSATCVAQTCSYRCA